MLGVEFSSTLALWSFVEPWFIYVFNCLTLTTCQLTVDLQLTLFVDEVVQKYLVVTLDVVTSLFACIF